MLDAQANLVKAQSEAQTEGIKNKGEIGKAAMEYHASLADSQAKMESARLKQELEIMKLENEKLKQHSQIMQGMQSTNEEVPE